MRDRKRQIGVLVGAGLVVLGGWMLLERVFAPLLAPLDAVLHALSAVAWPLALVFAGALLIANSRGGVDSLARFGRSRTDRVASGVLGGLAEEFGMNSTVVRVAYVVFVLATGLWLGAGLYVVATLMLPERSAKPVPSVIIDVPPVPES